MHPRWAALARGRRAVRLYIVQAPAARALAEHPAVRAPIPWAVPACTHRHVFDVVRRHAAVLVRFRGRLCFAHCQPQLTQRNQRSRPSWPSSPGVPPHTGHVMLLSPSTVQLAVLVCNRCAMSWPRVLVACRPGFVLNWCRAGGQLASVSMPVSDKAHCAHLVSSGHLARLRRVPARMTEYLHAACQVCARVLFTEFRHDYGTPCKEPATLSC